MKKTTLIVIWIAAIIGVVDSGYLAYVKLFHTQIYCTPGLGDCASVNASRWATLWGIPIAIFGFATYLSVIALLVFGPKIKIVRPNVNYLFFGIGLFGFLYSLFLTYIEIFVLRTICQWCVLSAICISVIFLSTIVRLKDQQSHQH
jgi:uncharacterized membrane protein